jgi:hypothetical protein
MGGTVSGRELLDTGILLTPVMLKLTRVPVPKVSFDVRWTGSGGELSAVEPVLLLRQQLLLSEAEERVLQRIVCDQGEVEQS